MIWHPDVHYRHRVLSENALVLIVCVLAILFGLAAAWIGYLY
jgi:hypothetical protein